MYFIRTEAIHTHSSVVIHFSRELDSTSLIRVVQRFDLGGGDNFCNLIKLLSVFIAQDFENKQVARVFLQKCLV